MADDALTGLDEALARAAGRPRRVRVRPALQVDVPAEVEQDDAVPESRPRVLLDSDIWVQIFFAIQFLWGIPLFLPGAQSVRFVVRALPYLSSLGFLVMYATRSSRVPHPRGAAALAASLLLLVLNLLHPTSQIYSGMAQCIFQLSIAAPMFWMHKAVRSPQQLSVLLVLLLAMNFASSGMGVLQVYYPDRFMPQLSAQITEDTVGALTYIGADGRVITRPPGLSDTPGGAAVAGGLTAILGLGLALRTRKLWHTVLVALMSTVGLAAVYLTQVRSVLLMTIGAIALIGLVVLRQGRVARAGIGLALGGALIFASFLWASSLGGAAVEDRFLSIRDQGALSTYQQNRGHFLSYTLGDMLSEYPLGAGIGRWGMMYSYFGDPSSQASPPIWVEIQPTGWLLDGGLPLWFLYGSAMALAFLGAFRLAAGSNVAIGEMVPVVLAVQAFILGMSFSGPAFNTQLGIFFWAATAALYGASRSPGEHADGEGDA